MLDGLSDEEVNDEVKDEEE